MIALVPYLKKSVTRQWLIVLAGVAIVIGLVLSAGLALYMVNLSSNDEVEGLGYQGTMPDWSLEEMVERSRAVVVGEYHESLKPRRFQSAQTMAGLWSLLSLTTKSKLSKRCTQPRQNFL